MNTNIIEIEKEYIILKRRMLKRKLPTDLLLLKLKLNKFEILSQKERCKVFFKGLNQEREFQKAHH